MEPIAHTPPKYVVGDLCYVTANLWGFSKGEIVQVTSVDDYDNSYRVRDFLDPLRTTWFDEDHLDPVPSDTVLPERTNVIQFRSGYMSRAHDPQTVSRVFRKMWEKVSDYDEEHASLRAFDTLVGTGLSGSLVVPQLARSLSRHLNRKITYLLVRKDNDGSHSSSELEGEIGRRWLFVDDLIESGSTIDRCVRKIRRDVSDAELVGVFLYGTSRGGAGRGDAQLYPTHVVPCVDSHGNDTWRYKGTPGGNYVVREFPAFHGRERDMFDSYAA